MIMERKNHELIIREIAYDTEDYHSELQLRDRILRKPLGMSLFVENLTEEKYQTHIGAYVDNILVGVLILTELSSHDIKMRQVAVDNTWQNQKVGTKLVTYAEIYSKKAGYKTIVLNARKTAVTFYEKLGYNIISEEFPEIGIPHLKMMKNLNDV